MAKFKIQYFAALREARGIGKEMIDSDAQTAAQLYEELGAAHGFKLPVSVVKVAVNGDLAEMDRPLSDGDEIVFIPPVAGG